MSKVSPAHSRAAKASTAAPSPADAPAASDARFAGEAAVSAERAGISGQESEADIPNPTSGSDSQLSTLSPQLSASTNPTSGSHSPLSALSSQLSASANPPSASGSQLSALNSQLSTPGLTPFETEVVEVFVGLSKVLAFPKSYGEIYGLLFASAEPLSFSEIQEKLGLSKGSVSQGLRALRELGAVALASGEAAAAGDQKSESRGQKLESRDQNPISDLRASTSGSNAQPSALGAQLSASGNPGARTAAARDRYVPVVELRRLASAFLQASIEPQLTQSQGNLTRAGGLLEPAATTLSRDQRELLLQRLGKLQTWHKRAGGLLPWAVRFLG